MLGRLADGELTVGELAAPLAMSLAAASKHIDVLERPMTAEDAVVCIQRTIRAPPDRVYRAWLDPDMLPLWLAPGSLEVTRAEVDERVGGRYRIRQGEAGGDAGSSASCSSSFRISGSCSAGASSGPIGTAGRRTTHS